MRAISNANAAQVVSLLRAIRNGKEPTPEMRRRASVLLKKLTNEKTVK